MRIASRTARRFDAFDRRFDKVVTPHIFRAGFVESEPYVFRRNDERGQDVIYFDIEAKSFIVEIAFRPRYMDEIDDLYALCKSPKDPEVGGFSYLTPVCMTHRPKEFPCKIASQRDHSFDLVVRGLNTHALSWLKSLREPAKYADAVAPTAIMYVARANEVAGRIDRAREAYEDALDRDLACWEILTFRQFVESEVARVFVYVCLKLGRELEKCERVASAIKYRPVVPRLERER